MKCKLCCGVGIIRAGNGGQQEDMIRCPECEALFKNALATCREALDAFDNGKRKHHRDWLAGGCISGCQACAIEMLKRVLASNEKLIGQTPKTKDL